MALVAAPSQSNPEAPITNFGIRLAFPGQSTVASRFSGATETIGRGPGLFAGHCTWYPKSDEGVRELERFFYQLQGAINHTRIYLPERNYNLPKIATPTLSVTAAGSVAQAPQFAFVTTNLSLNLETYFKVGKYINIGERLYRIFQVGNLHGSYHLALLPKVIPEVGAGIQIRNGSVFVKARAASPDQGDFVFDGWRRNPTTWEWIEAV